LYFVRNLNLVTLHPVVLVYCQVGLSVKYGAGWRKCGGGRVFIEKED